MFTSIHIHINSYSLQFIFTSIHIHINSYSHQFIFTSIHIHINSYSHQFIFTSIHIHLYKMHNFSTDLINTKKMFQFFYHQFVDLFHKCLLYSQTKKCTTFMLLSIFLKRLCQMLFGHYRVKFVLNILGKSRFLRY